MLQAHHLSRRFGDTLAVNDVSFTVPAGLLTGFVGANGAGKTTTMRMLMGLLAVHGGEVLFDDQPITRQIRASFGYMPEERGLYPKQAIGDQLVYLARLHGVSKAAARIAVNDLLERFHLAERSRETLESLSLGNQQRVQIAAAVVAEPTALVLDEPFSGLDPLAVDDMVGLLRELSSRGVGVLFSSHQLDVVERICDRLVILAGGRVAACGTVVELRARASTRLRLVMAGSVEWVRAIADLEITAITEGQVVVISRGEHADQELLREAMARGTVREFAPLRPSVADLYRSAVAA